MFIIYVEFMVATTIISKQPGDRAIKWKKNTILCIACYMLWKTYAFLGIALQPLKYFGSHEYYESL